VSDLRGKTALVTGAASGIGAASARHLAARGANVIACDLSEIGVRSVADEIGATAAVLDVSDVDAWERLLTDVFDEYGAIDFAHLNAGIPTTQHPYSILDVTVAQYRRVMGVNLDGVLLPTLGIARLMRNHPRGAAIVATASLAGLGPYYDDPFYGATKHAVVAFVRSAAPQLEAVGIRIHAICPGGVQTALIDDYMRERIASRGAQMLDPAEVADAVGDMLTSDRTGLVRVIVKGQGVQDAHFHDALMPPPPR
jgi:NAD(P)-dependent dehydrogenase (short-subunit alcohol dehydrogenase family)